VKDHLPFGEFKSVIADKLPNAPLKPHFKIHMGVEHFKKYFAQYQDIMKKKIIELDAKSKYSTKPIKK
jgi:hypothetical protein